jgi:exopolyphosphatase/guanosine-5'-triphosphate,3'-diphosphate pyrophosphatase
VKRHQHKARRSHTARQPKNGRAPNGHNPTYAAIDLGTNNCRLLIAEPNGSAFKVIDSFSRIVRLGEGLTVSGKLTDDAIERTTDALKICAQKIHRHNVSFTRSVATEACRQASNSEKFLEHIESHTGIKLETIEPEEEAHLTLAGCLPLIDRNTNFTLAFDIGGGSTEIMWIANDNQGQPVLHDTISIQLGVVSLAEKFGHDTITPENYQWIIDTITRNLDEFDQRYDMSRHIAEENVQMLGTSGTVTTLAGIHLDLPRYDRSIVDGLTIDFESIHAIVSRLVEMDYDTRCAHPCIRQERADLMIMGCVILDAVCRRWPVSRLRVADRGIREGILLAMMNANQRPPMPAAAAS